jgi:hypothetical protein
MFKSSVSTTPRCFGVLLVMLVGACLSPEAVVAQIPNEYKAQINRQVALTAAQPAKISARLIAPEIQVGSRSQVEITILNADNEPLTAKEDWPCAVAIQFPSGKSVTQTGWIKKGASSGQFEFVAEEAGLVSVSVRPPLSGVRPYKLEAIVRRPQKSPKRNRSGPAGAALRPGDEHELAFSYVDGNGPARLVLASLTAGPDPSGSGQNPQDHAHATPNAPVLHLAVSDLGGSYRANGKDAALISANYESPDFSPAPTDIHMWFHWANGGSLNPQPLLIAKGTTSGATELTSLSPADVHVNFVSSTPPYRTEGDTEFTVHFVPPVVALVGPEKLSVVDNTPVMIVFLNASNEPVAPGRNWRVTLRCKQSKLHFAPATFDVQGSSPTGSAALFPVSWGSDTVEALLANYSPPPLSVVITGWMVLALCLGGGVAGGLAAYDKFKGSWLWRIFLGILGGAILTWLYVYLALPNVSVDIAHNTFSVFFVAVLGGYLGTTVLDFAAKQLGWI